LRCGARGKSRNEAALSKIVLQFCLLDQLNGIPSLAKQLQSFVSRRISSLPKQQLRKPEVDGFKGFPEGRSATDVFDWNILANCLDVIDGRLVGPERELIQPLRAQQSPPAPLKADQHLGRLIRLELRYGLRRQPKRLCNPMIVLVKLR
jgi:hypothetical protein